MPKFFRLIRGNIIAGVLLLLPLITTIYVFVKLFELVDSALPTIFSSLPFVGQHMPQTWPTGVGIGITLVVAYFAGLAAKNYIGKLMIQTGNSIISNIPILNKIYLGVQQILDAAVTTNKKMFDRPVLIEYPKENSYCIGFVTSSTTGEIPEKLNAPTISLFVPTTPNPTSGFLLFLPQSEVIELDMGVETAIKLVMSAGMVNADQLKKTQHLYAVPTSLKNFNWLRNLRRRRNRESSSATQSDPGVF